MKYKPSFISLSYKIVVVFLILFLTNCQTGRRSESANIFRSYSNAIEQYQAKNYQDALNYINEAIAANTKIAQYFELKGDILFSSNEPKLALKEYIKAKELRFSPGILIKIGNTYYRLNDLDSAVKNFRRASAQKPEQTGTLLLLVNCYIQQQEHELALNQLKDYKKQNEKLKIPINPYYFILLGKVYYEKGMFKECTEAVEKVSIKKNRNECLFYIMALYKINEYERAYRLVTIDYSNILLDSDIHFFRGLYYFLVKNFNVAKIQLELSVNDDTEIIDAYKLLSDLYIKEGKDHQASEILAIGNSIPKKRDINIGL